MSLGLREDVSKADWIHLTDDEHVEWSGRPSRYTLLPAAVVTLVLVLLGVGISMWAHPLVTGQGWPATIGFLPLLLGVVGIAYGLVAYLKWLRLLYVITDEKICVKIGLISRDVTQVPFNRVQNTNYTQSVLERILSFGTIHIYTAGTHTEDLVFEHVPNPQWIKGVLMTRPGQRYETTERR